MSENEFNEKKHVQNLSAAAVNDAVIPAETPADTPTETPAEENAREEELFAILDRYMALSPTEFPTREEVEREHPALASEIWRCLEGMQILQSEEASGRMNAASFDAPTPLAGGAVSSSRGGKKPEISRGLEPVGDFELVREIARGGMGIVYEAWQNSLNRLVALKVLPLASTFDERQLQRFHNEAAAAAQLEHPGIVPIYAVGCERGIHFYAMKLINGPHLGTVIQALREEEQRQKSFVQKNIGADVQKNTPSDGRKIKTETESHDTVPENTDTTLLQNPATPQEQNVSSGMTRLYADRRQDYYRSVADLMRQAADALEYAHQCGVIHRDIKPANLMLDADRKLWITDFGLALVRSDVHITRTGEIFGTPRYMSPEQAQGNHRLADHRVDIYSLGATFYEFLTLHPIFPETDQVRLLKQILQDEPVSPHMLAPQIPHDLETILLKCIAKAPGDRYESASELSSDLERFLEKRPIQARRPGILEITSKWLRRHPWFIITVGILLASVWVGTMIHHQMILQEKKKTQVALSEAQARFEKARTAADRLIKIAEEELSSTDAPEIRRAQQKVLDTALVLYQDFLTIDELDPETEKQLTAIRNYVQQFMEVLSHTNGMPPIFLLINLNVQNDLNLTQKQRENVRNFGREFFRQGEEIFRNSRDITPEERVNRLTAQLRATDSFMKGLLTPTQAERLRQIQLQMQPEMICSDEIRGKLELTDAQTQNLERLFAASHVRPADFSEHSRRGNGPPEINGPREMNGPKGFRMRNRDANSESAFPRRASSVTPPGAFPPPVGPPQDEPLPPKEAEFQDEPLPQNGPVPPEEMEISEKRDSQLTPCEEKQAQIETILTPTQLEKWNALLGEKFEKKLYTPGRRRGPHH